jgi:hypothetical protein
LRMRFSCMSDETIIEEAFEIAWSVLDRAGELGDRECAAAFLSSNIIGMVLRGERRRLLLSNRAIDSYRQQTSRLMLVS